MSLVTLLLLASGALFTAAACLITSASDFRAETADQAHGVDISAQHHGSPGAGSTVQGEDTEEAGGVDAPDAPLLNRKEA